MTNIYSSKIFKHAKNFPTNNANCAITNECRCIHANFTNGLKRTFTNDNELGFSPIRQYAHDDVGSFSSMCEEALPMLVYVSPYIIPPLPKYIVIRKVYTVTVVCGIK